MKPIYYLAPAGPNARKAFEIEGRMKPALAIYNEEGLRPFIPAETCEDQRRLLQIRHDELARARAALDAADCAQTPAEEVGDAICRLAGERDHARAARDERLAAAELQIEELMRQRQTLRQMLTTMGRALGIQQPETEQGRHRTMHRVLHLAARQPEPATAS